MSTTTRPISTLDYTIHTVPLGTRPAPSGSLNGRLTAKAANDCLGCLSPSSIGKFFSHIYADCSMFFRAFTSMGRGTTQYEIDARINEITQFMTVIDNCGDRRNSVSARFQRLSPQVRDLFHRVNQNYVNEFARNPQVSQEYREEMLRECERAISFQRQLALVNTFYQIFSGRSAAVTTIQGVGDRERPRVPPIRREPNPEPDLPGIPGFRWQDFFAGVFGGGGGRIGGREPVGRPERPAATTYNVNVPGTVAYVQNRIPADVQQKADEINRLKPLFEALRPTPDVPLAYNDPINFEMMSVPVFDASHPAIQTALEGGVSTSIENRDIRHLLDKDTMEAHIAAHPHSWAPAKCPTCRHPEHGGVRPENLRIDTALQDQILAFLRNAVPAGATSTTTTA
jgi:hypothetical protein